MKRTKLKLAVLGTILAGFVLGIFQTEGRAQEGLPEYGTLEYQRMIQNQIEWGANETQDFQSFLGNLAYYRDNGIYPFDPTGKKRGQIYEIHTDPQDPARDAKVDAVHKAVQAIIDKGLKIPYGLKVYCTSYYQAENRAFPRNYKWEPVAQVIIKESNGVRNSLQPANGFNGAAISVIHEIGHILHERDANLTYWNLIYSTAAVEGGRSAATASKVSGYAGDLKTHFVAEVFAGLIIGKRWPADVMEEYRKYGGPNVPGM